MLTGLKKTTSSLGNEEKSALIDFGSKEISVTKQCELLSISRSSAYHTIKPKAITQLEIDIKNAMDTIHYKEPSYGKRRMVIELEMLGFKVGRKRVNTYMNEMGIHAFYPGLNLSKRAKQDAVYPYRLRDLNITKPNQVWSIDITYIGTATGFVYMSAIIDWHSRFLLGYTISNTLQTDAIIRTVKEAISTHGKPEIINSDQGSQFTSKVYTDLIRSYETITISMDGKGRATDNIAIERFFRSYKWERLYYWRPQTVTEVKAMTKEYVKHYNYGRGHMRHEYLTPANVYFSETSLYINTDTNVA